MDVSPLGRSVEAGFSAEMPLKRAGRIAANASFACYDGTVCHAQGRCQAKLAVQKRCASCHLPSYAGQEQIPRLARQRIDYLAKTLMAYRDGSRSGIDTSMNDVMYRASDQDIRALAHYLGSLR
jgi:cytochrome c553